MTRQIDSPSRRTFTAGGLAALAAVGLPRLSFAQAESTSTGKRVPQDVEQANVTVVNGFCAAVAQKDMTKIKSLLADNCTYRPTHTTASVIGKEKVVETIQGFLDRDMVFDVLDTVAFGPLVLNARDDTVVMDDGRQTYYVAAGLFFVENGQIVEWTDYFLQ